MKTHYDIAVIGAGVFGSWIAHQFRRAGTAVVLLDPYGPGNNRASSGGESRIMRMGYGADEIYTRSAERSLNLWRTLFEETDKSDLFRQTGVLWLARDNDAYSEATVATLQRVGINFQRFTREELRQIYPEFELGPITWGILEPDSGVLMARQAVRAVVADAQSNGLAYIPEAAVIPTGFKTINSLRTVAGTEIFANQFVFACGAWLPKLFPDLLGELIHVTKQEVFFFGQLADHDPHRRELPAWIDFKDLVYGLPNLDNRGVKIAIDAHGADFDPDTSDRLVSASSITAIRTFLAERLPQLAHAPITETRVCQYENTSNGDFVIDRHPAHENVWLVGGGSGHGFKHGPAVAEYVVQLLRGNRQTEPRFTLATKRKLQDREVY
ncbi:MAG: FAD-dependent oxidoreductase [Pyrinomonadaceae bacterium]